MVPLPRSPRASGSFGRPSALRYLGLLAALGVSSTAHAIRPFVTDDARVVGAKRAQLETWVQFDRRALEHNAMGTFGATEWLEVTAGLTHGVGRPLRPGAYSLTGPIVQAKAVFLDAKDNVHPGFGVAVGAIVPAGFGDFVPSAWGGFAYLAVTHSLFAERLLLHANLGVTGQGLAGTPFEGVWLAGIGAQALIGSGVHAVAECYHGDAYEPDGQGVAAVQVGLRWFFNEDVQVDGTFGSDLARSSLHPGLDKRGTVGLRLVTPDLW